MFSKLGLIILVAAFALVPVSSVQASSLVPSETHYYTVQLRSDKRALNYARIVFENKQSEGDQESYKFSLPKGTKVQNLSVQQVLAKNIENKQQKPCEVHEAFNDWYVRTNQNSPTKNWSSGSSNLQDVYEKEKACIQQNDSSTMPYDDDYNYKDNVSSNTYNYRYYNYYDRNAELYDYSDLKLEEKDGEYTAQLSNNIKPGKQGSVLVSYIAEDLVSGFMGRYDFNYRTLVSKNMISNVTVAINFDEEMYSREAKHKRAVETSRQSFSNDSISSGISAGAEAPSRSTDNLLSSVGRGGVYTKTQSNLLPGDVMSVKGTFAEHPVLLFIKEIIIALLVLAAIVFLSIFGRRYYRKKHPKAPKDPQTPGSDSSTDHANLTTESITDSQVPSELLRTTSTVRLGLISSASFFAALIVGVAGAAVVGAMSDMSNSSWGVYPIIQIILVFFTYIFIAFLLPLAYVLHYYSTRNVLRWAIIHLLVFVVLGVVTLIFGLLFMNLVGGGAPHPPSYY